eukprot:scaffold28238_cov148-Isochrysis_galbana.AAC.1
MILYITYRCTAIPRRATHTTRTQITPPPAVSRTVHTRPRPAKMYVHPPTRLIRYLGSICRRRLAIASTGWRFGKRSSKTTASTHRAPPSSILDETCKRF